ncbi:MAG: UvrD-helicase domain-containing protein [Candidatus Eisenbacteria bacterium]
MSRAVRLDDAQRAAVELEGRDLLVTAGAGTGKTTVLIERVLRKLRTGASSLDRLLLVTFTEKAAREMGERLREVLVEDPTLRPHLAQLGRASISTIHGFCARLLREHFLEAEIDPAFRILDERGQKEAMDDALRRVFHDAYRAKEDGRRFRSLVDMAGFDQDGEVLRKFVIALHETSVSSEDPEQFLRRLEEGAVPASAVELSWWPRFVDWIYEECRESAALLTEAYAIAEATGGKLDPHHRVAGRLSAITRDDLATPAAQAMLISALEAEGWLQASARGKSLDLPRAVKGAKELPGYAELVDTAKSIWKDPILKHLPVDEAKLLRDEETQRDSLRVLARLTRELSHRYGEWKSRFGLLDYSDLEVRTLALLRRHGDALAIRDRYDEVMIDEYQDVNQLQEAILERVSRAGRRFRVGDVKQSIYEFRQADPTLFRRHAESSLRFDPAAPLPAGSAPMAVFLRRNHRSRPPILTAINALFSRLFDARTIGTEYAAQALEPPDSGGDSAADVLDRPVELHLLLPPPRERNEEAKSEEGEGEEAAPGETGPEREARFIARNLRRWLEEANRRREGKDVLSYRDVAILLRTTSHAQDYQAALTAEAIPSALHDAESLLDSRPVQDLRALLRVVDNPRNDIALAAVLRSPIVEFSDSDLTRIRLAWPEAVSYLDALVAVAYGEKLAAEARAFLPPSAEGGAAPWIGRPATLASRLGPDLVRRAREFLDRVQAWRAGSEELPLARFMVHLLEATDLRARLLAMGEAPPSGC